MRWRFLRATFSLMVRLFATHRTCVGITMPSLSAWTFCRIMYRPSVQFPIYRTSSTVRVINRSQDSFSSTSRTSLYRILTAVMMILQYSSALSAVAFRCAIAVIAHLTMLLAFMVLLWAMACWWKSPLLIADAISWSISLRSGTLLSLLTIRCLSAMLYLVLKVGPGRAALYWLWIWILVQGLTVVHHVAGEGVGIDLGSCFSSGCCWSCSFSFSLGFGCCYSWCSSGIPFYIAPACCKASRTLLFCLAVSSMFSNLASWFGAASMIFALANCPTVMSAMPVPHSTLCLWRSFYIIFHSSRHSFMQSDSVSSCAKYGCSNLAI